jgi:hypothetical protein
MGTNSPLTVICLVVQMLSPDDAMSDQHHVSATMHTKQQALAGTTGSLLQWMQQSRSASSGHGSVDNELGRASLRGATSVAPYACVGDYAPAELVPGMRKGRYTSSQVSSKATVTCRSTRSAWYFVCFQLT